MINDDDALAAYLSNPVQARYQSWETPNPVDSARALIVEMRNVRFAQPGVWLQIGIETGGRLIGVIAVRADCDTLNRVIAWMVAVIRACAVVASSVRACRWVR